MGFDPGVTKEVWFDRLLVVVQGVYEEYVAVRNSGEVGTQ